MFLIYGVSSENILPATDRLSEFRRPSMLPLIPAQLSGTPFSRLFYRTYDVVDYCMFLPESRHHWYYWFFLNS